ncbi:cell wall hydrolase [Sphingomonas sp. IW22]|uniref:cell wall hydrolase n=1 Tax=Sphingomonas sp. IW22 TaxID=3242489 RepID=UPI0035229AE5
MMALRATAWAKSGAVALLLVLPGPQLSLRRAGPVASSGITFMGGRAAGWRLADVRASLALTAPGPNGALPIAAIPARVAPPFFLSGSPLDRERAVDCLAAAAYYEAGLDARGQRAVMQVVLNRVRSPAYPRSICGVVFQGSERATGCQFTFTCDGSMDRRRPSPAAWAAARARAVAALNGPGDENVGHATHYHTDWVHPPWSRDLDQVAAVDTHLFFQANARRPGNFSGAYAAAEPLVARLSVLSASHRPTGGYVEALVEPVATTPPPLDIAALMPERLPDRSSAPGAGIFLVSLNASDPPEAFHRRATTLCRGLAQCKLIGWTDPDTPPSAFPLPGRAIDAIAFSYNRTGSGAPDEARWDCKRFPRPTATECLNRS